MEPRQPFMLPYPMMPTPPLVYPPIHAHYHTMDYHQLRKAYRHCKKASKILKHLMKHYYWESSHWDGSSS
jgi:hypothetical protein